MSIATEITRIQGAKADIKASIEGKGVTVPSQTKIDGYASLIDEIPTGTDTDGLNGFLSVTSKTIPTGANQTENIAYNKHCGIYDENGKKWDTLEWHQRWVNNGYSAAGLSKPIGIWMNVFGLEIIYLWPLSDEKGYSDVTGTLAPTKNTFGLFVYNQNAIIAATAADRTVWPCNQSDMISHGTAGKYKSDTWRAVKNGDGLDMVCLNTGETFTIPRRNVGNASAFMKDNYEDYMWSHYVQCEFCRALFAVCSGIATNEADGETTTVEIVNASGQQASVGEDMYFWIGGTNTGLLAKYNLNSSPATTGNSTSGNLTQAIADAIYNAQVANGVNMNDTGVNSASKPVLLPGMKGAEAIAVDGYWYIKTPFISNPNAATFNASTNMADAPAVYLCKHKGVTLQTDRRLYPYYLNKVTHITALINLLRDIEGLSADVPAVYSGILWSAVRSSSVGAWSTAGDGYVGNTNVYARYACVACPSVSF